MYIVKYDNFGYTNPEEYVHRKIQIAVIQYLVATNNT